MAPIVHAIIELGRTYEALYGHAPTTIYVGREEHAQMRLMPAQTWAHPYADTTGKYFCGLRVYRVNAPHHLALAHTPISN